MLSPNQPEQRGMTLIELMIGLTLGLILLATITLIFVQNNRSYKQGNAIAAMQDNARFGLEQLSRDLMMAGYWGGMYNAGDILPNSAQPSSSAVVNKPNPDCGVADSSNIPWAFQVAKRVEFRNQNSSTTVNQTFPCLTNDEVEPNTDIVVIRRASGQDAAQMAATASNVTLLPLTFYLQTNGTVGTLIFTGSSASYTPGASSQPLNPPMSFYNYNVHLYFIRTYSRTVGDGIPTLCRMQLQGTGGAGNGPGMVTVCLADGVENLQITWGLDLNGDGVVDQYSYDPSPFQLANEAITARIQLLVRSTQPETGFSDQKAFTLGDVTVAAQHDDYRRRLYTTLVGLHNPIGQTQ